MFNHKSMPTFANILLSFLCPNPCAQITFSLSNFKYRMRLDEHEPLVVSFWCFSWTVIPSAFPEAFGTWEAKGRGLKVCCTCAKKWVAPGHVTRKTVVERERNSRKFFHLENVFSSVFLTWDIYVYISNLEYIQMYDKQTNICLIQILQSLKKSYFLNILLKTKIFLSCIFYIVQFIYNMIQ